MSTNEDPPPDEESAESEESFTEETNIRVKWLGSLMSAFAIIGYYSLVFAVALGYASLDPLTLSVTTVFNLLALAAGTWTFGVDLIDEYKK